MTLSTLKPSLIAPGQEQVVQGIFSKTDVKFEGIGLISADTMRKIEDKALHLSYCNNKDRILSFKVLTLLKLERFLKNKELTYSDIKKAEQLFTAISNMKHL